MLVLTFFQLVKLSRECTNYKSSIPVRAKSTILILNFVTLRPTTYQPQRWTRSISIEVESRRYRSVIRNSKVGYSRNRARP